MALENQEPVVTKTFILNVVLGKFYHEVNGVAWIIDSMWMCMYVERTEQGQENHFHHPKLHRTFKKQTIQTVNFQHSSKRKNSKLTTASIHTDETFCII